MKAFLAWLAPLVVVVLIVLAATGVVCSCYNTNDPPPCRPGSVDWPRCDPTSPTFGAKPDGGRG